MELGIIGFAKSGKTTLFNALSRGHAETAAFGRTSLEPLVAVVKVPDDRLDRLATLVKAKKITHAEVQYLDIGSTSERFGKGDGIAGPLLNALGRCDALIHVARTFSRPQLCPTRTGRWTPTGTSPLWTWSWLTQTLRLESGASNALSRA